MRDCAVRTADPHDVRTLSVTYRDGHHVGRHRHEWAQLIYASSGMMRVVAQNRLWLCPPTRAVWIPPEVEHEFRTRGDVALRTVYLAPERAAAVERPIGALEVSGLLGELVRHVLSLGMLDPTRPGDDRLAGVLTDLIGQAPALDLALPLPSDPRALRLAGHFQDNPDDRRDLAALALKAGASVRTLQRCFVAESRLSIDAWRQKARLIASTAALAQGTSVTTTALDHGFDSPSAFIAAFRRQFGVTPGQFAKSNDPLVSARGKHYLND